MRRTPILNIVRSLARDLPMAKAVDWTLSLIPDFSKLTLFQRFTDGASALGPGELFGLVLYAAVPSLLFLAVAGILFERKEI